MTTSNLNPHRAPEQSRMMLLQILSDHACERGFEATGESSDGPKRRTGRASRSAMPAPDLMWLKGKKPLWKFYIFPKPSTLKRLRVDIGFATNTIICADSSDNLGIINPLELLEFLSKNSATIDRDTLRSLGKDISPIEVPSPDFHFKGIVRKNHQFIKDHFSLSIKAGFVQSPRPGQFIQLLCDPAPHSASPRYRRHSYSDRRLPKLSGVELVGKRPFLRRPFSIAFYGPPLRKQNIEGSQLLGADWLHLINRLECEFEIIYRRVAGGAGTGALAQHEVGDEIDVVGPLGKGFTVDPLPEVAILIGGGIGSPPLMFLAEELVRNGVEVKVFLGAVTRSRIPFQLRDGAQNRITRFERMGLRPVICTDDGAAGFHGLVTDALLEYVEKEGVNIALTRMFACGPRSMLAALDGIANHFDLPCEVLLEERMACGFGACISCVCAVKSPGQKARFTRICTEGPAFDVRTVMWHV